MTVLTQAEQLFLELTNRARLDPQAEADRQGITLNQFIVPGTPGAPISADPKQPLAGSNLLTLVAEKHATVVMNKAIQNGSINFNAHDGAGDGAVNDRIKNGGYVQTWENGHWYRTENFSNLWSTAPITSETQIQNAVVAMHNGLFYDDPEKNSGEDGGHRLAMLDPIMKEMGAGMSTGFFGNVNQAIAFENFGASGPKTFVTGAVYNDTKIPDNFYSIGEAVQGVTVTVRDGTGATGSDQTGSGGGYSVAGNGGTSTVTFSNGISAIVEAGSLNAKVDLVNGNRIDSSVSTTLSTGGKDLRLLGMSNTNATGNGSANTITGNKGANTLDGKGGSDSLDGAGGIDTVNFSGNKADYQITKLSATSARFTDLRGGSPDGTDTTFNIEKVHFNDGTFDFSLLSTTAPPPPPAVPGSVSIDDVTVTEGANGQIFANFTVTRAGGTAAFNVNFATADGSAQAGDGDYATKTDTLRFGAGIDKQTVSIAINGDTKVEGNETFSVTLSGATNGATISRATGTATINNDDVDQTPIPTPTNHKPVVTTSNVKLAPNGSVGASQMFSATDADGNGTITQYILWDGGKGGGHFTVGGVAQAAGQWIYVNAADLGAVRYVAGPNGGSEKLYVSATDGTAWATNVSLTAVTGEHAPNDFNGNFASDVLWQKANGSVAMWQMNGKTVVSNKTVGSAKDWNIEGTGDFGGDGKADILFRNDAGKVALWQMDGNKIASNQTVGSAAKNWDIGAVGDFNGDGKADVLWTSTGGKVAMWQMDGKTIAANKDVGTIAKGWHVKDAADFNGDGKDDLLLQSDGGSVAIWTMDGTKVLSSKTVGHISDDWDFSGIGDFNGNGKADILWHNENGKVAMWQMNGNTIASNKVFGTANKTWDVADVGDYNKDGHSDILWQKSNGATAMWQMDGTHIDANVTVSSAATDWLII